MLHTFMTSCLHKLVRVCLAVISLIAFSHRIFKHKTIVTSGGHTGGASGAVHQGPQPLGAHQRGQVAIF